MKVIILFILIISLSKAQKQSSKSNVSKPSYPIIQMIQINHTVINLLDINNKNTSCFGNDNIEVREGEQIHIIGNMHYVISMAVTSSSGHYHMEQDYGKNQQITVNSIINAQRTEEGKYEAHFQLHLACRQTEPTAYYKAKAFLQINFYDYGKVQQYQLHLLMLCAKQETVEQFKLYYLHFYVIFWMIMNLSLQIYHNYPRKSEYCTLFFIYMFVSLYITNQLLLYIFLGFYNMLLVFKQRKTNRINSKILVLYLFFASFVILQIYLTYLSAKTSQSLNGIWILFDNFIITHVSMFMSLRLVKLTRLRDVFWYFLAISIFSMVFQGNYNRFFIVQFKNLINLRCLKVDLFFPIMMLPISNFFTTIVAWMHRPFVVMILIASVVQLRNAIQLFGIFCCLCLIMLISMKNIKVIQHKTE